MTNYSKSSFEQILENYRKEYIQALPEIFDNLENTVMKLQAKYEEEMSAKLFRDVHSLKGTSGTYDLPIIAEICHEMEEVLEQPGKNKLESLFDYIDLMRKAHQKIKQTNSPDFTQIETELYGLRKRMTKNRWLGIIVDPSRLHTSMIQKLLEPYPVQLTVMNDGLAALSRLLFVKYDFLITSRELPSLSGVALVSALKNSNCANKNIKSILLSSESNAQQNMEYSKPDFVITKDKQINDALPSIISKLIADFK